MEFKGTKGNWQYSISNTGSYIIIVDNIYQGTFRDEYNALLTSKAPEMLEMIKKLMAYMPKKNIDDANMYYEALDLIKQATEL